MPASYHARLRLPGVLSLPSERFRLCKPKRQKSMSCAADQLPGPKKHKAAKRKRMKPTA